LCPPVIRQPSVTGVGVVVGIGVAVRVMVGVTVGVTVTVGVAVGVAVSVGVVVGVAVSVGVGVGVAVSVGVAVGVAVSVGVGVGVAVSVGVGVGVGVTTKLQSGRKLLSGNWSAPGPCDVPLAYWKSPRTCPGGQSPVVSASASDTRYGICRVTMVVSPAGEQPATAGQTRGIPPGGVTSQQSVRHVPPGHSLLAAQFAPALGPPRHLRTGGLEPGQPAPGRFTQVWPPVKPQAPALNETLAS
jgi:hypothetical protein